jgi:hypothetical protein
VEINDIYEVIEAGRDLMSVLRTLGLDCLNRASEVQNDKYVAMTKTTQELRDIVATESLSMWGKDGAFRAAPGPLLNLQLEKVSDTPGLATITVLEGICIGAASIFFANASSVVRIDRGLVVPLPERWLATLPDPTPNPGTTHPNLIESWCKFVLWDSSWTLQLDYTFRDRLDDVCAVRLPKEDRISASGTTMAYALPKIATVHPLNGNEGMEWPTFDDDRMKFFGVRPKLLADHVRQPNTDDSILVGGDDDELRTKAHSRVYEMLVALGKAAPIAVLPEFCLHSPDGLDGFLASSDREVPDLVVAGSAHTRSETLWERANTSHVFLDQYCILSVSKSVPFQLNTPAGRYAEDISPPPRVLRLLAGSATRLAVAICSDLNSEQLVTTMAHAGVNILLAPSWTPKIGGFDGGLEFLAEYCQCIGVISNTPGHPLTKPGELFWAYSSIPRAHTAARCHVNDEGVPAAGVLDPNVEPEDPKYWTWLTLGGQ